MRRISAIELDIRLKDEGVPMTAEDVIAAAEAMTSEWCNADSERAKRRVDQLVDINGHRLDTMPESGSGWVRCHECGRVADVASEKYWSKVSCNRNRWVPEAKCNMGQYMNEKGAVDCLDCNPGLYQNVSGHETCKICAKGQHQPLPGNESCVKCNAGQYMSQKGAVNCLPCIPGTYQVAIGLYDCKACAKGQHQHLPGKASCIECNIFSIQKSIFSIMQCLNNVS